MEQVPQRKPCGETYLGYHVPDEFRPVEQFVIEHEVPGFMHVLDFFIYATNQHYCEEKYVQQTLPYIHPLSESDEVGQQLWHLVREQLKLLPDGSKVLEFIAKNREDLK